MLYSVLWGYNKIERGMEMTGNDLLKFTQRYLEEFPEMANKDVIVTTPRKRRFKGDFYHRFGITSIGMSALIGKDNLNLGIESIS